MGNSMFHTHYWKETERIVSQPLDGGARVKGCDEDTLQRLVFGVTSIVLTCGECGDKKTVVVIGMSK